MKVKILPNPINSKTLLIASGSHSNTASASYVGRFAPSPTGPLHAGSLVAAMASYLDARAYQGRWLLRIEDVDEARTVRGAAASIINAVAALGMRHDGEILWQSTRGNAYAAAFSQLRAHVYPCACSRREIADSQAHRHVRTAKAADATAPVATLVYPGTCRHGMPRGRLARAWRLRVPAADEAGVRLGFKDRLCGCQEQDLAHDSGDFVLRRADEFWAYQLAVVTDDAEQGVTHVVRGMDLLDSTPRQIYLQRLLGVPTPTYLHTPLVCNASGEKLSKQTGAAPLNLTCLGVTLAAAARVLGLDIAPSVSPHGFWQRAIPMWGARYPAAGALT